MDKNFKVGDRVILTGKGLIPYKSWPVWGSKYSCVGTINDIGASEIYSNVHWDNGTHQVLQVRHLSHFNAPAGDSLSPNIAFLKYKRKINE